MPAGSAEIRNKHLLGHHSVLKPTDLPHDGIQDPKAATYKAHHPSPSHRGRLDEFSGEKWTGKDTFTGKVMLMMV